MSDAAVPTGRADRIGMLDTTRGVAVLGILLMNIVGFGLPEAYENPANWGGHEGANLVVWRITSLFFEGTMRGLFTLMFGASALLFLQRHAARTGGRPAAKLYYRRTCWLIVFGLINGYLLLWEGDILFYYGVVGLLLFAFRNFPVRRLLVVGLLLLSIPTVMNALDRAEYQAMRALAESAQILDDSGADLTGEQHAALEEYRQVSQDHAPQQADIENTIAQISGSYSSAFRYISPRTFYWETEFFIRYGLAETLGMMLLGMALLRLGILTGEASRRTYAALMLVGYAIGLTVNLWEMNHLERAHFAVSAFMDTYLTYDLGRVPMTLGHVGLLGLLWQAPVLSRAKSTLGFVGQMALTNYLTQSMICSLLFTGAGLGLFGQLERYELYYIVGAIWLLQLLWSPWWLRRYQFGPLEWVWRTLTYGSRQPMRIAPHGSVADTRIA